MKKKYLVFSVNFSGVSENIFSELRDYDLELDIVFIPKIWRLYFLAIILSFDFNYNKWILKSERKYNMLQKSTWAFKLKSRWCAKYIKRNDVGRYSGIIQVSGTYDCTKYIHNDIPLYILTDYTMKLAEDKNDQNISPLLPPSKSELIKWYNLESKLYLRAKKILIPSKYIGHSLVEHYGVQLSSISVVGYGSNLHPKDTSVKRVLSKDGPHFLFVGKMFEQKGGSFICDAFSDVKKVYPNATLTIVGPRVDPCISTEGVKYLGRIYDKDRLSELYNSVDMFLIHSAYEAFGLVLLEAMAHGLPCIGSDIDAMPDILVDSNAGSVVPFGSSLALTDEILRYLSNQELFSKASESGIKAVKAYYNWNSVGKRFYKVLVDSD
ncbi:glycosyltransferase family 4 protein [Vibrio atypicus]|uniref:glycosyltransferase family 4 protein n=1 Tax=Vibrio atypicus TaxID=558271 RepID=UPI0013580D35|nr:glycosyltransferase family 4 protein [Vibrio atypicus]